VLFNSLVFLFAFLPATLVVFFWLGAKRYRRCALAWLALASCVFYAYWDVSYLILLLASIGFNFIIGMWIARIRTTSPYKARALLVSGVTVNLVALGVFKYSGFAIFSIATVIGHPVTVPAIVLPLAISFFTFNQIAYLVDTYQGKADEPDFLTYLLFVSFFPHLIAGPIVHHTEMIPQFRSSSLRFGSDDMAAGITIFSLGLFKKVVLADSLAPFSDAAFAAAGAQTALTFGEAWLGTLAYALQLYFDFSGYSDMAIGLARMFGVRFPLNFFSPYQAVDISDFWRRWHMTLSRFLREYLYIPLGGNRKGEPRRYLNLLVTMLLGGLWHGAAWTFVAWGGLHGAYLVIHHLWVRAVERFGARLSFSSYPGGVAAARVLTLIAVMFAWVCFRAGNFGTAASMWSSMLALNGLVVSFPHVNPGRKLEGMVAILLLLVLIAPNTEQVMARYHRSFDAHLWDGVRNRLTRWVSWTPNLRWAIAISTMAAVGVIFSIHSHTFLYFQF
jgi:alginate O-acetyltransferase complex protein AlgI